MDRREFIKKTALIGFGAGLLLLPRGLRDRALLAARENACPDAIRGETPEAMFDRGMRMIGGMGRFVKNGQTVLIKRNMSGNLPPEYAVNTSPGLVAAVLKHCRDAGARRIMLMDYSQDYRENSGIPAEATDTVMVHAPAEREGCYQRITFNGKRLKETMIHKAILECELSVTGIKARRRGPQLIGPTASLAVFIFTFTGPA
jgi:hypothetical protein